MAGYLDNAKYQEAVRPDGVVNVKPKELGILQRADGLRNGLQQLQSRLQTFTDRLDGNGSDPAKGQATVSASLSGTFADAETELRLCLQMIDALNDRF